MCDRCSCILEIPFESFIKKSKVFDMLYTMALYIEKKKEMTLTSTKNRQNAFSMALTSYHVTLRKQAKTCSDMCPFVHGFKQIYALIFMQERRFDVSADTS